MEEVLALAAKQAEHAEVFQIVTEETPVNFEANHLKEIQSKQSTSLFLRIIKNGRLGFAAASGMIDNQALVNFALETAEFGQEAVFSFPSEKIFPSIHVFEPEVEAYSITSMIQLGENLINPVLNSTPGIICEASITRNTQQIKLINSQGGQAQYRKSVFGANMMGTLVRDTDMLFVGDGQESCQTRININKISSTVLRQLELAKNMARVPTRNLPVIFTPNGLASAVLPSLMVAFNGKIVLQGASPIGEKLGEQVFNTGISLYDDPVIEYAPHSRPFDDEGIPSQRTVLIEKGLVRNFLYDLQTAGQAKTGSTGSGNRGRTGLVSPAPSAFTIEPGNTTFEDMVRDIKEGLIIEYLMGAEQGNVLGGDFSGNVLLGYKIENGEIVGRVKNTMVSGNVYQLLQENVLIGNTTEWVGGHILAPHICCQNVAVASK